MAPIVITQNSEERWTVTFGTLSLRDDGVWMPEGQGSSWASQGFALKALAGIELAEPGPAYYNANFVAAWNEYSCTVNNWARDKGFWDEPRNDGEMIALIHSELSEALEALRHGNPADDKLPNFQGATAELADAVIRIMDMAAGRGWAVGEAICRKMQYNVTRPRKHGKQF